METKYLERFKKLTKEQLPLRGSRLIVEVLPKEEIKTKGGLIVHADVNSVKTTTDQNRPTLAVVLATGSGYYDDETGDDVAMDVPVGAVCLISQMGLKYYSHFPGISEYTGETIALTRESEIHMYWPNLEAYQAYKDALNA